MDRDTGDQQDVAQTEAQASGADERDAESGFFNRAIRTMAGWFGGDDEGSDAEAQEPAEAEATTEQPKSDAQIREQIRREEQSRKDAEIRDFRRDWATRQAEAGNLDALVELAEKYGDAGFAKQELAKRGAVYEAGQIVLKETEAQQTQQEWEQTGQNVAASLIPVFHGALFDPVLKLAPQEYQDRILAQAKQNPLTLEQQTEALTGAVAAIEEAAVTKMLSDEKYVRRLLGESSAFRTEMLRNPVVNKQLRAFFRGELDDTDLIPGVGRGGGLERENDVMNAELRAAAGLAPSRATSRRKSAPEDDE